MGEYLLHTKWLIRVLKQAPQFPDFIRRKFVPLDEVREHGPERPAENALQKRLAGRVNTIFPPNQRAIHVGASFLAETQDFLFDQPVEKGLGGAGMPRGVGLLQDGDDLASGTRTPGPDDFHHLPLGFRNSRHFSHGFVLTINVVIGARLRR